MRNYLHKVRPRFWRRGNAVMEAALVMPMLLGITFGTVEFGYFFFCKHTMQGAARDGARTAILPSATNATVTTAVANTMTAAGFASNEYTVAITNATTGSNVTVATATSGTPIKVAVSGTWSVIGVRPVGNLFGNAWPLKANTVVTGFTIMVKE